MRSIRRETRLLSQPLRPRRKAARISASADFERCDGGRPGVQRFQRVDQHDLAVEAGEMVAEEGPDHRRLIALVAARHHRGERARWHLVVGEVEG